MFDDAFEIFARKICEFCMKNYVVPYLKDHGVLQSYRAKVNSIDADAGTMEIERPFDEPVIVPYTAGASDLTAGSYCTVFVFGDSSNARVVADGNASTL